MADVTLWRITPFVGRGSGRIADGPWRDPSSGPSSYSQRVDVGRACAGVDQHEDSAWHCILWVDYSNRDCISSDGQECDEAKILCGEPDVSGCQNAQIPFAYEAPVLSWIRRGRYRMSDFLIELWAFMKERKKFWLLPIIVVLLLLGSLIVLTQGSAVAPFIYTLF
jgi:hypothetical protein